MLLAAILAGVPAGWGGNAIAQQNDGMFRRFASGQDESKNWQTAFEFPVALVPQTMPDSDVIANEGVNYVVAFKPLNRVYFSRSIGYARMEWKAKDSQVRDISVIQWDLTQIINITVRRVVVISMGIGLGFMDGLTVMTDGSYQTRLEPFVPVQAGVGVRMGRSWFADVKWAQSSYFGPGPVASAARYLVGLGYNY